jgi:hypothetical protein
LPVEWQQQLLIDRWCGRFRFEDRSPRFHTIFIAASILACMIAPCFTNQQDNSP